MSKLRNLLLIICQILILVACTLILTKPVQIIKDAIDETEVIMIIDSSASMRAENSEGTRFERAVYDVEELAKDTFDNGGIISVILADEKPHFLSQRVSTKEDFNTLEDSLHDLVDLDLCSYAQSDVNSAIILCEDILLENPKAKIYLYTDTVYSYVPEKITVVQMQEQGDWNVGILDAKAEKEDNYYKFSVDVACYGFDKEICLSLTVGNPNVLTSDEQNEDIKFTTEPIPFSNDEKKTVVFMNADLYQETEEEGEDVVYYLIEEEAKKIFAYQTINITAINPEDVGKDDAFINDSFWTDNTFSIYNGQKETLRIQYVSGDPNLYIPRALSSFQRNNAEIWDVQIRQVKKGELGESSGYDFYIYEHIVPEKLPTDGIIMLMNYETSEMPRESGIRVTGTYEFRKDMSVTQAMAHPFMDGLAMSDITVWKYVVAAYDPSYQILWECDGKPMLLVKNEPTEKIIAMPFSLNYSSLAVTADFPLLITNIFNTLIPSTLEGKSSFEVGEKLQLKARGEELSVSKDGSTEEPKKYKEFPAEYEISVPGTYTLSQYTFTGDLVTEKIFAKIPASESNIWSKGDALDNPYKDDVAELIYNDLMKFIAAALVLLLFLEWWLQSRENM